MAGSRSGRGIGHNRGGGVHGWWVYGWWGPWVVDLKVVESSAGGVWRVAGSRSGRGLNIDLNIVDLHRLHLDLHR